MVTITNYKELQKENGTSFYLLQVQGGIEMIRSKQTGDFYATAKKAYVPSTFDEITCKNLIGSQMSGEVVKKNCEPFEYTVKETGEVVTLSHRWVYVTQEDMENKNMINRNEGVASKNNAFQVAYA